MQRRERIAETHADARRCAVDFTGRVTDAAHRLADRTEARTVTIRAGLTVAGNAHHRQSPVQRVQHVPAEAELFERTGTQIFDDDVGIGGEALDDLDAIGRFQIHADGLLVARLQIPPQRRAFMQLAPFAKGIASFGRFDLDHVGAEFGHQSRGERRGNERADLDDTNTL
ncbi:hypothetical protein QF001_001985 [Paraburkholderia youngii]